MVGQSCSVQGMQLGAGTYAHPFSPMMHSQNTVLRSTSCCTEDEDLVLALNLSLPRDVTLSGGGVPILTGLTLSLPVLSAVFFFFFFMWLPKTSVMNVTLGKVVYYISMHTPKLINKCCNACIITSAKTFRLW